MSLTSSKEGWKKRGKEKGRTVSSASEWVERGSREWLGVERSNKNGKKQKAFSLHLSSHLPCLFSGSRFRWRRPSDPPPPRNATMRVRTLARAAALALLSAVLLLSSPRNLAAAAEELTSLDKGPWTLSNGQGVSLPVSLPKYALEAMQDAGLVGDPLWR